MAKAYHSSLSVVAMSEHTYSMLSSTCLKLTGRDGEQWELDRRSPTTPGPTALEDPKAWAMSPQTVHPGVPGLAPGTTKL
jgi:hypothetical protein